VTANVVSLTEMDGEFYITACLVEDNIVGWQTTSSGVDREYVFRNVFRGTLNGADGESFANGSVYVNDEFAKNYTATLNEGYNADQCYILTYVADKSRGGKILQTAMEKIK
jgi:hypothetical protein